MCHKHKWLPQDCQNVNWLSLKLALQQFSQTNCQCLQKFLHDWLPLCGASHTQQLASPTTCLVCQQDTETYWHFLECQHVSWQPTYQQLQQPIWKLHDMYRIEPHMLQLLWQGINFVYKQYPIDDQFDTYPTEIHNLFTDQSHIG